jgi:hypothetical protein
MTTNNEVLTARIAELEALSPAAALGRLGGAAKSERKTEAVRENARKPRPNARGKKKPRKTE